VPRRPDGRDPASQNDNLPADVRDRIPDVRDGLTRVERIVIWQLHVLEKERKGRMVPTAQLYGRVVEYVDITERELSAILARLGARK
jgi:hypothetical protein